MRHVLITGASRGIGLELARQYAAHPGTHVHATCQQPARSAALAQLAAGHANVSLYQLDVTNPQHVQSAFQAVSALTSSLSLLINNAAVQSRRQPNDWVDSSAADDCMRVFGVNVVGPLTVTQAFLPLLAHTVADTTPTVIYVTSTFGSLSMNCDGNNAAYKMSKAALNQQTRSFASHCPTVAFVALSPGWVRTDMGYASGETPTQAVDESVSAMIRVINGVTLKDSGKFLSHDGEVLPW